MQELIAGLFSTGYQAASRRTMALLLVEIRSENELPMPQDGRLSRVATKLLVNQRRATSMSGMADLATMSERSFFRLFIRDTGFRFRNRKQRARICVSLDLLSAGTPVNRSLISPESPARPRLWQHFVQCRASLRRVF